MGTKKLRKQNPDCSRVMQCAYDAIIITDHCRHHPHYFVPIDTLTRPGLHILLQTHPVPVQRISGQVFALAGERLLAAAHAHLEPGYPIPVIDYTECDSERIAAVTSAHAGLYPLYSALHPRSYPTELAALRAAIPHELREKWCPCLSSMRDYARLTGLSRTTLSGGNRKKRKDTDHSTKVERPLDRIRKGAMRDE